MTAANHSNITGVVLAGGLSRRMGGREKSLIGLAGRPMIAHVLDKLVPQVGNIVINANGNPARFKNLKLDVVADKIEGHAGPLAGILAGMRWAKANTPGSIWLASVAADTPFLPDNLVAQLSSKTSGDTIVLATSNDWLQPVVGLWPIALADALEHHLASGGSRKVLAFVDNHTLARAPFGDFKVGNDRIDPFFNVNTPDDLEQAEKILREQR